MKRLLVFPLMFMILGCAQNHFNVPAANFADKVRVLGVAPIMIDTDSDIKHPQKDELQSLIADMNRTGEPQFVRKLKGTGDFNTVALLDGDPRQIFTNLFFRREKRDDATIRYNKYFWKNDRLGDYIRKNNLDAIMLVVVSGLGMTDKITSSNLLKSMTSEYNYLIMTAQILDADGTILWEYPNFRSRILTYDPLINLQYPDFDEADANLSATTNVKFKTIEGIRRTLDQKRKDLLLRETKESEVYGKQFDEMLSLLKYDSDKKPKEAVPVTQKPAAPVEQGPNVPKAAPASATAPPAATAPPKVVQPTVPAPAGTPQQTPPSDEIVPAKGSTL
jgi:hypothetical protein